MLASENGTLQVEPNVARVAAAVIFLGFILVLSLHRMCCVMVAFLISGWPISLITWRTQRRILL